MRLSMSDPHIRLIEGDGGDGGDLPGTDGQAGDGGTGEGGDLGGTETAADTTGDDAGLGGTETDDNPDTTSGGKSKPETFDRKYVEGLRDEAVKARKKGDADREALVKALRKAMGDDADADETDPAKLAASAVKERDDARAEVLGARRESAVLRAVGALGVDGDRLLDSRAFERALAQLDPGDDKFPDQVKTLIGAAADADTSLRTKRTPPPQGGARMGGEGGDGQLTRAQLKTMTPKQIEAAREAGKLRNLLGG